MPASPNTPRVAGVIFPPPLLYLLPLVAGVALQHWFPLPLLAAGQALPVGLAVLLLGFVALPAILAFRAARTPPQPWKPTKALVTTGPYRFSRNPMYVGFTLFYLGITLLANSGWSLGFLPLVLLLMRFGVIAREERYLDALFGEEYREYRSRVRRWL